MGWSRQFGWAAKADNNCRDMLIPAAVRNNTIVPHVNSQNNTYIAGNRYPVNARSVLRAVFSTARNKRLAQYKHDRRYDFVIRMGGSALPGQGPKPALVATFSYLPGNLSKSRGCSKNSSNCLKGIHESIQNRLYYG
jgi:hypothetical protein